MTFADLVRQFASKKLAALLVFLWFLVHLHETTVSATTTDAEMKLLGVMVKYSSIGFVGYCLSQAIEGLVHRSPKKREDVKP